jgi:hypothetical protein
MANIGDREKHLVCLLGGQTMPNLLAAADYSPDRVWVVCSKDSKERGLHNFTQALALMEKPPKSVEPIIVDPFDLHAILSSTSEVLDSVKRGSPNSEVLVDMTGGTKLMSFGAYLAAYTGSVRSQYVVTEREKFLRGFDGEQYESHPVSVHLPLAAYFAAHGLTLKPRSSNITKGAVREVLLKDVEQTSRVLGLLRSQYEMQSGSASFSLDFLDSESIAFFGQLAASGCGAIKKDHLTLDPHEQQVLWGTWVEDYVSTQLQRLCKTKVVDEVRRPSDLLDSTGNRRRELDGVAIRNGRVAVFSCKQKKNQVERGDIDNLLATREDLGTYVLLFLICVRHISSQLVKRAKESNVIVIHSDQLRFFRDIVQKAFERTSPSL